MLSSSCSDGLFFLVLRALRANDAQAKPQDRTPVIYIGIEHVLFVCSAGAGSQQFPHDGVLVSGVIDDSTTDSADGTAGGATQRINVVNTYDNDFRRVRDNDRLNITDYNAYKEVNSSNKAKPKTSDFGIPTSYSNNPVATIESDVNSTSRDHVYCNVSITGGNLELNTSANVNKPHDDGNYESIQKSATGIVN